MIPIKKIPAGIFLIIFGIQTFYPGVAFALTSGPVQPEMQAFQPAGMNDMVDLFSGDFKYNIPLLDVGGYPVNLAYQASFGMEEEASWVGAGWSLNPGAVNRTMRGLPDDFKGDEIEKIFEKKEFKKVGGEVTLKFSLFADDEMGAGGSIRVGVYKDNYYGIGANVGADIAFQLAKNNSSELNVGLGMGVNSDSRTGVDISPNFSIGTKLLDGPINGTGSLSGSFQYNTREGLKQSTFGATLNTNVLVPRLGPFGNASTLNPSASATHYFGQSYTPAISNNETNKGYTLNFDLGGTAFAFFGGVGGSGYYHHQKILEKDKKVKSYGYLNYLAGRDDVNALLDFNREKDGVYLLSNPALPTPVATQDFFVATGQTGSQQFRPYYGGDYIVSDAAHYNHNSNWTLGLTIGLIHTIKAGGRFSNTTGNSTTGKWTKLGGNSFLNKGDADYTSSPKPIDEPVFFKQVGEHTTVDDSYFGKINGQNLTSIDIANPKTAVSYESFNGNNSFSSNIRREKREKRNYGFSYLNAEQASKFGLDKEIKSYDYVNNLPQTPEVNDRITSNKKAHHISEIKIIDNEGKRMVYGIPVYNNVQEDVTFSVEHPNASAIDQIRRDGLINYTLSAGDPKHDNGRDEMLSKEIKPSYATTFLLTGILSPDYVDNRGDGITDDDLGTAVKFNYKKLKYGSDDVYKWRTPYCTTTPQASFNEGYFSDPKDDKASYSYGEKEIWYMKSIESKTMIAIFETSPREDGLGVNGKTGGKNEAFKIQKLDKIKLFSKAEFYSKGSDAIPIKVVHFEYDYSLFPGVPNAIPNAFGNTGKLTLKKIYFTFGSNQRGSSNPYLFDYDNRLINNNDISSLIKVPTPTVSSSATEIAEYQDLYAPKQQDRWGTYKQTWFNNRTSLSPTGFRLNNAEFPYSIQENENTSFKEKDLADKFASKWQMNKITTPSGSEINVTYESDDYAYVQNRRAMQMCFVKGVGSVGTSTNLISQNTILVELPNTSNITGSPAEKSDKFRRIYLDGLDNIYFNILVDLTNKQTDGNGHPEYVQGYAEIDKPNCEVISSNSKLYGKIVLKSLEGYNPISKSAWQKLRCDLKQFAYNNYDNTDVESDVVAAMKSIIIALGNFREVVQKFDEMASGKGFANKIDLDRSFIRLNNPDFAKLGGGARVKKIEMSDQWGEMLGNTSTYHSANYGLKYDYKIKNEEGNNISSGVASYEPSIGNDENPFHEPENYIEKVQWSKDNYHYMEKPYCEAYFPSAQVGYSSVTVTNIGDNDAAETGYTINEFYTAKDFPTIVENTSLIPAEYSPSITLNLYSSVYNHSVGVSQGFKVELNDMHGKTKSTKTYNKGGDLIASTEYYYSVENENALTKKLNNKLLVLEDDVQTIANKDLATDIDFVSDVRASYSSTTGNSFAPYAGMFLFPPFPIPLGFFVIPPLPWPYIKVGDRTSETTDTYNSISTVKIIHKYGIVKKVKVMQNGSTITTENLLWDGLTGEVLLTKTQNQFDDFTYAFSYPAHVIAGYEGMGASYKNAGAIFKDLSTTNSGSINNTSYSQYLFPGDELIMTRITAAPNNGNVCCIQDVSTGSFSGDRQAWVITDNANNLRMIDFNGQFIKSATGDFMIIRSGRRNILNAGAGSVILAKNPIQGNILNIDIDKNILDAKAVTYNSEWGLPAIKIGRPEGCAEPSADEAINPYTLGVLGNWRTDKSYVYTTNRVKQSGLLNQQGGTNIQKSGYYEHFTPFWLQPVFGATGFSNNLGSDNRWVYTNRPVYFDRKGNEIENVDALNRYGSALFGYKESLATAVAANARHNEIVFEGFEDYNFNLGTSLACPNPNLFRQITWGIDGTNVIIDQTVSHTGNYSLKLLSGGNTTIHKDAGNSTPLLPLLNYNSVGSYNLVNNEPIKGFAPVDAKWYLLSMWVNENESLSSVTNVLSKLNINVNSEDVGPNSNNPARIFPIVEGWKKIEIKFQASSTFNMSLSTSDEVYIDDIRIIPFEGQMNSYVYDDKSLRLMAQLDENNFAKFYEYDQEGTLIRVKKETDRGIMTLKENRKYLRIKRP